MDGGLGAFIPGVTIGLTLAIAMVRVRDDAPWKVVAGIAVGLLLAAGMFLLLDRAGTDLERLWIVLLAVGSVAIVAAAMILTGTIRRLRGR